MIFTHIRPGAILSILEVERDIDGVKRIVKDWEVKEIFPHHVLVRTQWHPQVLYRIQADRTKACIQESIPGSLKERKERLQGHQGQQNPVHRPQGSDPFRPLKEKYKAEGG